jgi:hypothetical protein
MNGAQTVFDNSCNKKHQPGSCPLARVAVKVAAWDATVGLSAHRVSVYLCLVGACCFASVFSRLLVCWCARVCLSARVLVFVLVCSCVSVCVCACRFVCSLVWGFFVCCRELSQPRHRANTSRDCDGGPSCSQTPPTKYQGGF